MRKRLIPLYVTLASIISAAFLTVGCSEPIDPGTSTLDSSAQATAQNAHPRPILGAFGRRLGESYEGTLPLKAKYSVAFEPDEPYEPLKLYTLALTPQTHRIVSIAATGKFASSYLCEIERLLLADILEQKYAMPEETERVSRRERVLEQNNRYISIRCDRPQGGKEFSQLSLTYSDTELREAAAKETEAREQTRNTEGL